MRVFKFILNKKNDFFIVLTFLILGRVLNIKIFEFIYFFIMTIKVLNSDKNYTFNLILLNIPLIAISKVPIVEFPISNYIIIVCVIKFMLLKERVDNSFIIFIIFIMFEYIHIIFYNISSIKTLISWCFTIIYIGIFVCSKNLYYNKYKSIKYFAMGCFLSIIYQFLFEFINLGKIKLVRISTIDRFIGGAGDPNYLSLYLLISASMLLIIASEIKKNRMLYISISLIFILVGFLTLSRSYILVLAIFMILYLISSLFSVNKPSRILVFTLFIIMALFIFIVLKDTMLNNFNIIVERINVDNKNTLFSNRNVIFDNYFNFMVSSILRLIFGIGVQKYNLRMPVDMGYAHNMLLEILIAWGVLGIIILSILVYVIINADKKINNYYEMDKIYFIPLIIFLIFYQTLNAWEVESFFILLIFMMKNITVKGIYNDKGSSYYK